MGLPSEYKQLQYIQSNGAQYIDTGINPNQNYKLEIKFQTTQEGSGGVAVSDQAWQSNGFGIWCNAVVFGNQVKQNIVLYGTEPIIAKLSKQGLYINDTLTWSPSDTTFTTPANMTFMALNRNGTISENLTGELYYAKIYDSDTLVRNFVPCTNSSNVAGLYDLVNNKFYASATSTAFVAGPPVTIKTGDILNYDYTGAAVYIDLPKGQYKLECWGAEGGYRSSSSYAGKGGYSVGTLTLSKKTRIYIRAGGSGNTGGTSGGFNGGGKRSTYNGGGGASDIRIEQDSLYARVIVAGGGGSDGATSKQGMYGGGETGGSTTQNYGTGGYGGTQTGVSSSSWQTTAQSSNTTSNSDAYAGFGFGGNGVYYSSGYGGAGGGGWYGGSGAYPDGSGDDDRGGGGGSGYVYTSSTASNYPTGCLLDSTHYLSDASTIAGNTSFTSPTGSSETGHSGNGYVRITAIKVQSLSMPVNIGGSWKDCNEAYVNIGGEWKAVEAVYVNINGAWKECT